MDDPKTPAQQEDFRKRFEEPGEPIGTGSDGKMDIFPMSELKGRLEERDVQERAMDYALEDPEDRAFEDDYLANVDADDVEEA